MHYPTQAGHDPTAMATPTQALTRLALVAAFMSFCSTVSAAPVPSASEYDAILAIPEIRQHYGQLSASVSSSSRTASYVHSADNTPAGTGTVRSWTLQVTDPSGKVVYSASGEDHSVDQSNYESVAESFVSTILKPLPQPQKQRAVAAIIIAIGSGNGFYCQLLDSVSDNSLLRAIGSRAGDAAIRDRAIENSGWMRFHRNEFIVGIACIGLWVAFMWRLSRATTEKSPQPTRIPLSQQGRRMRGVMLLAMLLAFLSCIACGITEYGDPGMVQDLGYLGVFLLTAIFSSMALPFVYVLVGLLVAQAFSRIGRPLDPIVVTIVEANRAAGRKPPPIAFSAVVWPRLVDWVAIAPLVACLEPTFRLHGTIVVNPVTWVVFWSTLIGLLGRSVFWAITAPCVMCMASCRRSLDRGRLSNAITP